MAEYIDKQAVYDVACRGCTCHGDEPMSCFDSEPCEKLIYAFVTAPAADVALVRHGEWEWDTGSVYSCSVCGEKSCVEEVMEVPIWEFCPNCGARMDLGGADNG